MSIAKRGIAKIHKTYLTIPGRPDLSKLARCNNINGEIYPAEQLTDDDDKVTCGRCRRIRSEGVDGRPSMCGRKKKGASR